METATYIKRTLCMLVAGTVVSIYSCTDSGREKRQKSLDDLEAYVKDHKESADKYAERKWDEVEREYDEKKATLEKESDKLDREMKTKYERTINDWEAYKADYLEAQKRKIEREQVSLLENTLMPDYVHSDYSLITSQNIAEVYEHFVKVVNEHRDEYTKEEWTTINNSWKELNNKRDKLDKAISKKDDKRIFSMKTKYTTIKALNRPFAEHS
jgi:prefoldin subunit 5